MRFETPKLKPDIKENKSEEQDIEQGNIANEYKQEYKRWNNLNDSYQNKLKILDNLRSEAVNPADVLEAENELKSISESMDLSHKYMDTLFNKLSDESKEKYLK